MTLYRILDEIKINKIAAVDFPCQEGAGSTIMKRADPSIIKDRIADRGYDHSTTRTGRSGVGSQGAARMYATDTPPSTLDEAIQMIIHRDKVGNGEAMRQAGIEFPSLVAAYNDEGLAKVAKARAEAEAPMRKSEAGTTFKKRVSEIEQRDKCGHFEAYRKAAVEFPDECKSYAQS